MGVNFLSFLNSMAPFQIPSSLSYFVTKIWFGKRKGKNLILELPGKDSFGRGITGIGRFEFGGEGFSRGKPI